MSFNQSLNSDIEYFDITVSNLNSTSTTSNPILQFNETRANPFIRTPSDYVFYIVRFSLDTNSVPIWIPSIQSSQEDSDLTIYSVSMVYNGITVQTYMTFTPQDLTASKASSPLRNTNGIQDLSSKYYYVYNYQYVIFLLNNTLYNCFNSLASQTSLPTTNCPYFTWDTTNNTATLISDIAGFNDDSSNYISLYFNNALYQLFVSLPSIYSNSSSSKGLIYQISPSSYGIAPTTSVNGYTVFQCVQEYSTVSIWNPITSIVFCSNTMPMNPEQISSPLVYINGITLQSTNSSNINNIITDFESNDGIYKPSLVYQPYIFRYKQLLGDRALYNIDITCYFKNRFGTLIPFYLNSGCSATMKICFMKKSYIGNQKSSFPLIGNQKSSFPLIGSQNISYPF